MVKELTDDEKKEIAQLLYEKIDFKSRYILEQDPLAELKRLSESKKYVWQELKSETVTEIGIMHNGEIIER